MSKASLNVKTKVVPHQVVLTLTVEEAVFLRNLLGSSYPHDVALALENGAAYSGVGSSLGGDVKKAGDLASRVVEPLNLIIHDNRDAIRQALEES